MKPFGDRQPTDLTNRQVTDAAWDEMSKDYWWYPEGGRAKMPPSFETFYQAHKAEIRDVLDVGSGTGKFAIPMLQDGLDVTLLEPSPGMRKGAEINLEKAKDSLKGKARVVKGESKHLAFPDASFDLVFAKGSIHHNTSADIQQSFREVARVLKPGQVFIFQGRSPKDSAFSRSIPLAEDNGHSAKDTKGVKKGVIEHYFTEEEIRRLGAENGFEIIVEPEEIVRSKGVSEKQNARWWVVYRKI